MTRKPRSIATLAEVANGYQIDLSLPFRRLVFSVSNLLKQADQYRLEDDIEEAYVLYLRFSKYAFLLLVPWSVTNSSLVLQLRKHRDFNPGLSTYKSLFKNVCHWHIALLIWHNTDHS